MGVDLILAGIHAEVKSLIGEKLFLSQFIKIHKKKQNNAFDFCIIQFSQSYCFYLAIYVFTEMFRIQKERKRSYETYSFVWKCDRSNRRFKGDDYRFLVILLKIFVCLGFCFELFSSGLILTLPAILGLSSILGWVLHWPLLCLSWSLFFRLPWSDLCWSMGAAHCLDKLWSRWFFGHAHA